MPTTSTTACALFRLAGALIVAIATGPWVTPIALAEPSRSAPPRAAEPATRAAKPFIVFNALLYDGLPDLLARHGMPRMTQLNSDVGLFYPKGTRFGPTVESADLATMKASVGEIAQRSPHGWHFLDFEDWPRWPWSREPDAGPLPITAQSARRWGETARRWREALDASGHGAQRFGFYDVGPAGEYWIAVRERVDPKRYARWQAVNDLMAEQVNAHVDFVAPSCYTFYDAAPIDRERWVQSTIATIKEARRVSGGKPVYPFIWPQFHDSSNKKGEYLDPAFWRLQLDTVLAHADGVILWGGWDILKTNRPYRWQGDAPWWLETQRWLETVKASTSPPPGAMPALGPRDAPSGRTRSPSTR